MNYTVTLKRKPHAEHYYKAGGAEPFSIPFIADSPDAILTTFSYPPSLFEVIAIIEEELTPCPKN